MRLSGYGAGLAIALTGTLAACGQGGTPTPSKPDPAALKLLADLPAAYANADLGNGKAQFSLCRSCHTAIQGGANMTGPNLYGVFGRAVASRPDYSYSTALKAKGGAWDAASIDQWIADPKTYAPGTKMSFIGLKDAKDRTDLIAYLKVVSSGGPQ